MKKTDFEQGKDELSELLGCVPSKEQRLMIIQEATDSGLPLAEVADKYSMPPMVTLDENGCFKMDGELMTLKEFKARWPYRRIVIMGSKEQIAKYRVLNKD